MRLESLSTKEQLRLDDLYSYGILDSDPEQEYEELVELAGQLLGCPMAAITFIAESRQWMKAIRGSDARELPRQISFCNTTIEGDEVLVVPDLASDARFLSNPLVADEPLLRFYAGAPIRSEAGYNIGTVCVLNKEPLQISPDQQRALALISRQASRLLELRARERRSGVLASAQQELLQHTLDRQEREALRYSTELHEHIAQGLVASKFYLEMAEQRPDAALVQKSRQTVERLLEETRLLAQRLYPTTLRDTPFTELMELLAQQFGLANGIPVRLSLEGAGRVPAPMGQALYRILQEQLENVRQHAAATEVSVSLVVGESGVHFSISDNGSGFAPERLQRRYGLSKISALAAYFGGTVDLDAARGCRLLVKLPLPE